MDQIGAAQPQGLPNISRPCGAGVSLRALAELAAELSHRPTFAMRTLGTCGRTIEPIAKPMSTFAGHLLMFDPVQAPPLRHAFESVNAAILKADSRL
jgi:hypothetical protein